MRLHGAGMIRDIIGDSGSAMKQASESLDLMKAKMSSMFYGSSSSGNKTSGLSSSSLSSSINGDKKALVEHGPKDIMLTVISDLRSMVVSTKPGSTLSTILKGG